MKNLDDDLERRMRELQGGSETVSRSRRRVEAALSRDEPIYGINTGFGALADKRIDPDRLAELQRNLLLSHACGTGDPLSPEISRLMLRLKIHALALGYSGISDAV
ncbi:MAG: aromatic amino acid lyase, partial [Wenzhouxiangellaceae bacterium]